MKLSNVSIKKLVKGACYFEERGGYLFSYHYTKEQIDYFKNLVDWGPRARFSAGVKIELITDATELSLKLCPVDFNPDQSTVDLYIDGVAHSIYYLTESKASKITFNMPKGKKKVSIYLPINCEIGVRDLSFNGSYKAVKDKKLKVLAIGDSITQGYGAVYAGASYINVLSRLYGFEVMNQAIGGYRFDEGGVQAIPGYDPDRVLVALGTNYYDAPDLYDYEPETVAFFEKLNRLFGDKKTVVVTPVWRNNDTDFERLAWCTSIIKRECAKYENITVVNGFDLIPPINECFMPDKVHPNPYGMLLMADNLNKELKKIKF